MVLGVGRPEHRDKHPKLWSERGVRELVVSPLKDKPAERLVRAVLGAGLADDRVKKLVSKAAGNPYFLEELLRAEAEGQGDSTPDTVLAMVEARLLRLEPAPRRLLRAASVYGGRFDEAGLEAVLGEASPRASLEALVAREWLTALEGGGYVFRQATSREAAYAMLVEEDKRLAHARAAEHLAGSRGDPVAIAEHHERAQAPERAAPWWAKAATQALEANDFTGAIARAEAAERCGARGADLADALLARAEAHSWLADNPALCETAGRLAAVAKTVDQEAATLRWRALGAHRAGDTPKLEETLARACELCERHRDNDAAVGDAIRIATYALRAGAHARAEALVSFLESSDSPPESRGVRVFDEWLRWRAVHAEHAQETETAVHLYREASRQLRSAGNTRGAMAEQINLSSELLRLGAYDEAAQTLEASLSECERLGLTYAVAVTLNNLCVARLGLGRLDEALLAGRKAVATSAKGRHAMLEASSRDSTARVLLAGGHVQEAVSEAERALTLLPAAHPVALTARTLLADALLSPGGRRCCPRPGSRQKRRRRPRHRSFTLQRARVHPPRAHRRARGQRARGRGPAGAGGGARLGARARGPDPERALPPHLRRRARRRTDLEVSSWVGSGVRSPFEPSRRSLM
jgi:predicted ATPase